MSKKNEKNPLWERVDALEKRMKKGGSIYGPMEEFNPKPSDGGKKKNHRLSNGSLYRLKLMQFQFHLYEMILAINDIDRNYYFVEYSKQVDLANDIKFDDTFTGLSKLNWGVPSSIDGLQFRGKFATLLLFKIVRKTDKILTNLQKAYFGNDEPSKKEKYRFMNEMLSEWIGMVDRLMVGLLSSNMDYRQSLLDIERIFIMSDNASDSILKHLKDTDALLTNKDEDGLEANNITKMAFALATHSLNLKNCPGYDENLSYKDNRGALNQVAILGYAILKRRKSHSVPVLYDIFQKSDPKITSRFYTINEEAPEVTVGLKALAFSTMFYSDAAKKTVSQLM